MKNKQNCLVKKKVVIFGAGGIGRKICDTIIEKNDIDIISFVDNDETKHGTEYNGIPIRAPSELQDLNFDYLHYGTQMGINEISAQIEELKIAPSKIVRGYIDVITKARKIFVERFAQIARDLEMAGSIAEAGVYRGEFACHLNSCFPLKKLYLFDTFDGFDERDFHYETSKSLISAAHFKETSVDNVLGRMPFPKQCVIRQGYFPETTEGLEAKFLFVSLDLDLYRPTLEGLKYFYPRMVRGGCILIHDYFMPAYPNVKTAVLDFEKKIGTKVCVIPIGDDVSVAVIKV